MLPIQENALSLSWIAEYWSREIGGLRTVSEIHHELLAAFWRGELEVVGGEERKIVDRVTFLKCVALKRDHPGFVLIDSPEKTPPKAMVHADGSVTVDVQTYITLPSDQSRWTDDIVGTACHELAKLSWEDYHDLVKPAVNALRSTRQNLAGYCETAGYSLPRFWFGRERKWTARLEKHAEVWLKQLASGPKRKPKGVYLADAARQFPGIPRKAFNRIWDRVAP